MLQAGMDQFPNDSFLQIVAANFALGVKVISSCPAKVFYFVLSHTIVWPQS